MQQKPLVDASPTQGPPIEEIQRFLSLLVPEFSERRTWKRYPFCCPMTLHREGDREPWPGLVRDISLGGVGLVHDEAVEPGKYLLRIAPDAGEVACAAIRVLWCRGVGKYHYLSGADFHTVFQPDPLRHLAHPSWRPPAPSVAMV